MANCAAGLADASPFHSAGSTCRESAARVEDETSATIVWDVNEARWVPALDPKEHPLWLLSLTTSISTTSSASSPA